MFRSIDVGILESSVNIGLVDFDNGTDELFEAVENSFAQIRSKFEVFVFAGQDAIDDGKRNAIVARVEIRNANAVDGVVNSLRGSEFP